MVYWVIVVLLVWLGWSSASEHTRHLDQTAASLGSTVEVWVAGSDFARGDQITAETRMMPVAFVPDDALTEFEPGLVARQAISAGELIVTHDVADGPDGLVPDGWVVVAVVESPVSGASRGDSVRVASAGIVVSDKGVVVGSTVDSTLLAVPADAGPAVAAANQQHDLALLRLTDG